MPNTLGENDWNVLLQKIKFQRCTPFLGAGACYGVLPLGAEIAREWAKKFRYPFSDDGDLVRVAQYIAVQYDSMFAKIELLNRFACASLPNFQEPDEPHAVLADLPLPVYLTTNYDNFMVMALEKTGVRDPRRVLCKWNPLLKNEPSVFEENPNFKPTAANPVVFHLHGHTLPESLVLTEDDYLEFLGSMCGNSSLLPARIQDALANSTCLFIGYRMADWNFRVLYQGLRSRMRNLNIAVMPPPGGTDEERAKACAYLDRYYAAMDLRVYWGTAREFCGELRRRWKVYSASA